MKYNKVKIINFKKCWNNNKGKNNKIFQAAKLI